MDTYYLSELSAPAEHDLRETEADGVSLLAFHHRGQAWRLGSIAVSWRHELAGTPPDPGAEDLAALAKRGVWLHRADIPPPLALVCCGQGSVYPGMGRELYDAFPVAREAMDRLAAKADWDLLGLMDERDMEKIVLTRWQQPYLLLLEYAQFQYLQSLGLRPSVVAGHSLGEPIALCFAGAYAVEEAWRILDGRSKVMARLEESAQR
ncbi:MAG: acyltransferase domain-containing protein, partial [Deltaproteobacteria bacterium]|nr:acyltransferase domain-containing protein [Deltaproteobacteria bacterium]